MWNGIWKFQSFCLESHDESKERETSEKLWSLFPQKNIKILTDVICCEDHMPVPLIDGDTKIPVSFRKF